MLFWINPGLFDRDLVVIRRAANATSREEVREQAQDLGNGMLYRRSLVRDTIGVRASGRRLVALASRML
ncbi:MAG: hypothetical protein KIT22_03640 [Verrucomicrobiae bacterium]|nr:hypothetical protein [Verrucomicrobiae bacterium]